jgi:hypothetical protein
MEAAIASEPLVIIYKRKIQMRLPLTWKLSSEKQNVEMSCPF